MATVLPDGIVLVVFDGQHELGSDTIVPEIKTGSLTPVFERSNMPPKPPRAPITPARSYEPHALIRSTTS